MIHLLALLTGNTNYLSHRSWGDSEDSIVDVEADQQEVEDGGYEAVVAMFSKKGKKNKSQEGKLIGVQQQSMI